MKNLKKLIIILLLLGFVSFIVIGLINTIAVKKYEVISNKITNQIKIVQISDLHSQIYKDNQKQLTNIIVKSNPDLIVLTGDIADDKVNIKGTKLLLEQIKSIAPIYYVTGNHEYWARNTDEILDVIKSYGVYILEDEIKPININGQEIVISGINDPDVENRVYGDKFLMNLNKSDFNILLAHRPERINEYKQYNVDLVLSGHAHGGQFRIPFILNGLYAPNQGFFPNYAGGKYILNNKVMIVSRGLSFNEYIPRFYNRPEVVVINIKGITND